MSETTTRWLLRGSAAVSFTFTVVWYALIERPSTCLVVLLEFIGKWLPAWTAVAAATGIPLAALMDLQEWWGHRLGKGVVPLRVQSML